MIDFGCISCRILWIKLHFLRVKVCVGVGYGPNERVEERNRFRNDLDRNMDRVGNEYRLGVLRDLSRWIGDRVRAGITGSFGVPREHGKNVGEK